MDHRLLFWSRNVKTPSAANLIDPHQVVERPRGDFLGIETVLEHAIRVRDRDDGEALRKVLALD